MRHEMENQAHEPTAERTAAPVRVRSPLTDVVERADAYAVTIAMPAVAPTGVEVTTDGDVLTVRGRTEPERLEGVRLVHREAEAGLYQRTFVLSEVVDRERIAAHMTNGVLRLTLPKRTEARARRIAVTPA